MKLRVDRASVGGFLFEWMRGMRQEETGGALLGAASTIRDGDFAGWTAAWNGLADRLARRAHEARAEAEGTVR